MKKVLVVYINRAEEGMLTPIMKRIENDNDLELIKLDLRDHLHYSMHNMGLIYDLVYEFIEKNQPDIALVGFDRVEMIFSTLACYHNNVSYICHLYAGDCDPSVPVFDEYHRFAISVYANVHFCTSREAMFRVRDLMNVMDRSLEHIYRIPPTNLDDLEFDNVLVPEKPYDLVLLHPCSSNTELIPGDILKVEREIQRNGNFAVLINPNGDIGSELIEKEWEYYAKNKGERCVYYPQGVARPQFMALLRECKKFISNSSAIIYEAPYFLEDKQIIPIGLRNKGRTRLTDEELTIGGSDMIVSVLKELGV